MSQTVGVGRCCGGCMSYTVGRKGGCMSHTVGVEVGVCPTLWGRKGGKQRVFTAASPA